VAGDTLHYAGASGNRIVLLQSSDAALALCDWQRAATNPPSASAFSLPASGAGAATFYRLKCE
jgi:hypothetical protein